MSEFTSMPETMPEQPPNPAEEQPRPDDTPASAEHQPELLEDLTLAQALARLLREPSNTARALAAVMMPRSRQRTGSAQTEIRPVGLLEAQPSAPVFTSSVALLHPAQQAAQNPAPALPPWRERMQNALLRRKFGQMSLFALAFLLAVWGTSVWAAPGRRTSDTFFAGLPFLLFGAGIWLLAEVYGSWQELQDWFARRLSRTDSPPSAELDQPRADSPAFSLTTHPVRVLAIVALLTLSGLAFTLNLNNTFTTGGILAWWGSIALAVLVFMPTPPNPETLWSALGARLRGWLPRRNVVTLTLLAVLLLGAYFRLADLPSVPPEMTSDHYEKLLNAEEVRNGYYQVFFTNNGGREPFQMYAMALFSHLPGQSISHTSLKALSALEGILTLPVLFLFGREIIGRHNRRLGVLAGVLLAALVAASYWHTTLSREGLRIILTPMIVAVCILYLVRGLRDNNRWSYINAGLALGAGLYMYQAVRMLPVVVIAAGLLILLARRRQWRHYLANFIVLVVVALVVFTPMLAFWLQYPAEFWQRTAGRLFGDDVITVQDDAGNVIDTRIPTLQERLDAFNQNVPILLTNVGNALLMFNWQGDVAFINGAPNRPAMDPFTGALFVLGAVAWLARLIRRRDPVDWLVLLALFIMILPSALSIAQPGENPSATRMSGSLPFAYLLAALPLAMFVDHALEVFDRRRAWLGVTILSTVLIAAAFAANQYTYFVSFVQEYRLSTFPYSEAGRILRGFADSDGAIGNAFLIALPYGMGHREIGLEAGEVYWPNGIGEDTETGRSAYQNVPFFLYAAAQRTDRFRFDPERDILFFYEPGEEGRYAELVLDHLQQLFPDQQLNPIRLEFHAGGRGSFYIVRVRALGREGFERFVERTGARGE